MSINVSMTAFCFRPWRKLEREEIDSLLESHAKWLAAVNGENKNDGDNGKRADFRDADLSGVDFAGADLREADFCGSNLAKANFDGADLRGARFSHALADGVDFSGADLCEADLHGANAAHSNFAGAKMINVAASNALLWDGDFNGADLSQADLHCAALCDCKFTDAKLVAADLSRTDLDYAKFTRAVCRSAIFDYAKNAPWADFTDADLAYASFYQTDLHQRSLDEAKDGLIPPACPDEGPFVGWTKSKENYMVKLLIPEDAERISFAKRLCYASKAKTIAIYDENGAEMSEAESKFTDGRIFRPGDEVENCDEDKVAFFISRAEAKNRIKDGSGEENENDDDANEKENENDEK